MTRVALLPLLLALYVALRAPWATLAKHWTCWTGAGNDPYKGGYTQYCVGNRTAETLFEADYSCPGKNGFTYTVATYGQLGFPGGEYGIIEFATPCNGHGWAPNEDCDPSTWGLCLGIRSNTTGDFNECYYMQFYDDCEWPRVISNLDKPDHVTIFKKSCTLNEGKRLDERKRIAARSAERTDHVAGVFPPAARLLSQPASSAGIDEPRQVEDGRGVAGKEDQLAHGRDSTLDLINHGEEVELSAAGKSPDAGQDRRAGVLAAREESQQGENVLAKKTTRAAEYGKDTGVFARVRSLERERSASTQPMMTKKEMRGARTNGWVGV